MFVSALSLAQKKAIVACPGWDHPTALVAAKILPDIYHEAGLELEFNVYPPLRGQRYFENQTVDGWIFSDDSFINHHKKAIKINVPIGKDDIMAFSKNGQIVISKWSQLKPYIVGYTLGMLVVENHLAGLQINGSEDQVILFKKLEAQRIDVALAPLSSGLMAIKQLKIKDIPIPQNSLVQVPLYHFVNPKLAAFVPRMEQSMTRLITSGRLKKVTDDVLAEFLKP
jgi:ABC-type amino acid transport substrate-binding protein